MTNTTEVLTAAAASESVFFIPHFESIAVIPANRAENIAANIHISAPPFCRVFVIIICSFKPYKFFQAPYPQMPGKMREYPQYNCIIRPPSRAPERASR